MSELLDELIRRASEGCEGPMDDPCFRRKFPKHLWCDPCRCQEAAKAIKAAEAELARLRASYHELLFAVGRKYPNESRHQTALRYITNAEQRSDGAAAAPPDTEGA